MDDDVSPKLRYALGVYERWLHLPDVVPVLCVWGAYAGNRLEGEPVWLMLVGSPGSGKTEMLAPIVSIDDVYEVATLTEAALLSGSSTKDVDDDSTGGLLRLVGQFGVLVIKDFTSILSMHQAQRSTVLAALREIYDGSWTRHLGTDGGKTFSWSGKVGILAGVTPAIDQHHVVTSTMGERFILVRLGDADPIDQGARAISNVGSEDEMRRELTRAAQVALATGSGPFPELSQADDDALVQLAALAASARSAVERDGRTREIIGVPPAEAPARLVKQLARMVIGLRSIGVGDAFALRIAGRLAMDSLPAARRVAIQALGSSSGSKTTSAVVELTRYPEQTIRRALEELWVHQIVVREPGGARGDRWELADWARGAYLQTADVPEGSEGGAK